MVHDLNPESTASLLEQYRSHPHKALHVHTNGVVEGVRRRTPLKIAEVAALFHDLGKLNPNFQPKLKNEPVTGYSSHAYLSAYAFLCFCRENPQAAKETLGINSDADLFSVLALIARHHGNLPNFKQILSKDQVERLTTFLVSQPNLPISVYLSNWMPHQSFDVLDAKYSPLLRQCAGIPDKVLDTVSKRLRFFQETQFGFAALVEADKRDAGDNKWFARDEQLKWAKQRFEPCLTVALPSSDNKPLNVVRTQIRNEAVYKIQGALKAGDRVFSLTAPTGSGKTLTLLALAETIRRNNPNHSVMYALPFLTITEQVEEICRNIFAENADFVTRIDSRAQDKALEALLAEVEEHPEKAGELLSRSFSRDTFDAAFIITTFVQFFETLLSNKGSVLLRLPNFARTIFLLDEIQSLPPRLYVFLTAYLQAFCERFDSYVVLSTATMPMLEMPPQNVEAQGLFAGYRTPPELLDSEKYYSLGIFNRYQIRRTDEAMPLFLITDLAAKVQEEQAPSLIILNTIDDTRQLYDILCPNGPRDDVILLNTRFTLRHRRAKIAYCKRRLRYNRPVTLIATQLIEAGVDIDFPVVYRDLCPLPNLIQSAGRCNRNGRFPKGEVWFFEMRSESGKSRAELVYRDTADRSILDFTRSQVSGIVQEVDLLKVQQAYFHKVNRELIVGDHRLYVAKDWKRESLVRFINEAAFEVVGSFRLIEEDDFGVEYRFYVPSSYQDTAWEKLATLTMEAARAAAQATGKLPFAQMKAHRIAIDAQLRRISGRVVSVRARSEADLPPAEQTRAGEVREICGLRKLMHPHIDYLASTGLQLGGTGVAIF